MSINDYDAVRVYFEDGTETVIDAHIDDDLQEILADLQDTEGIQVTDYHIEVET